MKLKPKPRSPADLPLAANDDYINVDLFAGGGGASEAFFRATGRHPDVAVNHNAVAIYIHALNHQKTKHYACDVREVDPLEACSKGGKLYPVGHLHASPDCTHFSKARGGKPVEKGIRSLADVVVDWIADLAQFNFHPRLITLENVEEFQDWGPVLENGQPCPDNKGLDFRRWVKAIESFGYVVTWWEIVAADYGAPTTRNRLFVVARRDGQQITKPARMFASRKEIAKMDLFAPKLPVWHMAAEALDFSIKVPSIFDRKIALKTKTHARIFKGVKRYAIEAEKPFIVNFSEDEACAPSILPVTHGGGESRVYDPTDPHHAITAAPRGEYALGAPILVPRYGEREGQEPRAKDVADAYPTVVPTGNGGDLGMAMLTRQFGTSVGGPPMEGPVPTVMGDGNGGKTGIVTASISRMAKGSVGDEATDPLKTTTQHAKDALVTASLVGIAHGDDRERAGVRAWSAEDPIRTVSASNDKAVMAVYMDQHNGDRVGRAADEPITALTERATQQKLAAVCLDKYYGAGVPQAANRPLDAVTSKGRFSQIAVFMEQANTGMTGHPVTAPVSTIVGKGCTQRLIELGLLPANDVGDSKRAHVLDFLWEHAGAPDEADWADPTGTAQARLRFGLVILDGQTWMIVDIGMRMLTPRELFNAQGFRKDYIIDGFIAERVQVVGKDGKKRWRKPGPISKTEQTAMAGNSVSPPPLEAILRANLTWMDLPERMAA